MTETPPICNYEGSKYRTDFWQGQGRDYEDLTERVALRRVLPPTGRRLLEIGAGFGRLTHEYDGYDQIIVLDYSRSLLQEAQAHLGTDGRYVFVAANVYQLPIVEGSCDTASMIRVIHHMADVPAALQQIRSALAPNGTFILEFANKRNLKAIVRYLLRRQKWSPFDKEPIEFVKLNYDFHPMYMFEALENTRFSVHERLALSYLRLGILKRFVPIRLLVALDALLQWTGKNWELLPQVF